MRSVSEWTLADVEALIASGTPESLTLEYKASPAVWPDPDGKKRLELAKDVSALANSAGGTIIYGVIEKDCMPKGIDDGLDPAAVSREWLENTLHSLVQPRISGLVIKDIPVAGGRVLYAIDVPQATSAAPHQAADRKYYRRFNFKAEAMHDYEVRDAMRRGSVPELRAAFGVESSGRDGEKPWVRLHVAFLNLSAAPAFHVVADLFFDRCIELRSYAEFRCYPHTAPSHVDDPSFTQVRLLTARPNEAPIFREQQTPAGFVDLILPDPGHSPRLTFGYGLACPGFSIERKGSIWADFGKPAFEIED